MYRPNSTWTWAFLLVTLAQAIIALALEGWVFAVFQSHLQNNVNDASSARTIPTYLSLLIFGYVYQLVLVYDALKNKNTIQVIGLCLMNLGILVYTAIQVDQVKEAFALVGNNAKVTYEGDIRPFLVAVPCVMSLGTILLTLIAWKLYDEFAWTIYKQISADLRLKRRYLVYQIYIALLKFDFFLFLGFSVQFLVIVRKTNDVEFGLTIAAIPIIIVFLLLAAYWTRKENVLGMVLIIILYFAALAYFLFKLVRMYADSPRKQDYAPARRTLTTFAVITILMLLVTIAVAGMCTSNFNKGLKPHVSRRKNRPQEDDKVYMNDMSNGQLSPQHPAQSRMTID